jgi:hypothetical protein
MSIGELSSEPTGRGAQKVVAARRRFGDDPRR